MRGLPSILSLLRNKFNKFNIFFKIQDHKCKICLSHDIKLLQHRILDVKTEEFDVFFTTLKWTS